MHLIQRVSNQPFCRTLKSAELLGAVRKNIKLYCPGTMNIRTPRPHISSLTISKTSGEIQRGLVVRIKSFRH
jgi:hypothetical protein